MHHDRHADPPKAEAFRDSVLGQDPSSWSASQTRTYEAMRAPDAGAPSSSPPPAGWGHPTVAEASVPERPVAAPPARHNDAPAHVPVYDERVTERERGPARAVDVEAPVDHPRFSLAATFFGWVVAAFFTVLFSAIVIAVVGGAEAQDGVIDVNDFAIGNFVGYLLAAFFAYLLGGYVAGRISLWNGTWHGLGTVAWAVLLSIAAIVAGVYAADALELGTFAALNVEGLTTYGLLALGLALLSMLAGAALGGRWGERYHEARGAGSSRRGDVRGERGRPL